MRTTVRVTVEHSFSLESALKNTTLCTKFFKTPTQKITQEPKWDYHANFDVPEGDKRNVNTEVFDSDKFGKINHSVRWQ